MYRFIKTIVFCTVFIFLFTGCTREQGIEVSRSSTSSKESKPASTQNKNIMVYVCGQVKKPGVYELRQDDRIVSAIRAAGGLKKDAAAESVNQADRMKDGQQIYIPSKKEADSSAASQTGGQGQDASKININSASKEELMTLSGIGESKAGDIISYRQENGSFAKPEDIMNIQGIKEGVYNKIKDKITV